MPNQRTPLLTRQRALHLGVRVDSNGNVLPRHSRLQQQQNPIEHSLMDLGEEDTVVNDVNQNSSDNLRTLDDQEVRQRLLQIDHQMNASDNVAENIDVVDDEQELLRDENQDDENRAGWGPMNQSQGFLDDIGHQNYHRAPVLGQQYPNETFGVIAGQRPQPERHAHPEIYTEVGAVPSAANTLNRPNPKCQASFFTAGQQMPSQTNQFPTAFPPNHQVFPHPYPMCFNPPSVQHHPAYSQVPLPYPYYGYGISAPAFMPGHPPPPLYNYFHPSTAAGFYGYPPQLHSNTQHGFQGQMTHDGHTGRAFRHDVEECLEPYQQGLFSASHQRHLGTLDVVLTMDRLPDLNGSQSTDQIRTFFKKFSSATEDWPEKKRLSALESELSGRAERAFNSAVNNHPYRFDSISRAMMEQLEATDCREMGAFDELMSGVRRRYNEDLDALADRVSGLVRRAYPGLTQNLYDEYSIKHLIRTLANPELSLTLEISRRPGMSYDDFVALAARAEAVQKAARRSVPGFRNVVQEGILCYNCNEPGHLSRNCPKPKLWNDAPMSQNSGLMPSDAINTPVRSANSRPPAKFGQIRQEEAVMDAFCGSVQLAPEVVEFLENKLPTYAEENVFPERNVGSVGKIVALNVDVFGLKTKAMLDGGAQISLIGAGFFYKLVNERNLNLRDASFTRNAARIADVNGRELRCYGTVTLPMGRKGCSPVPICFHITGAPFRFDLLLGTNSMASLGFRLYDELNREMFDFEKLENSSDDLARVIFHTSVQSHHEEQIELGVGKEVGGPDMLVSTKTKDTRESVHSREKHRKKRKRFRKNGQVCIENAKPEDKPARVIANTNKQAKVISWVCGSQTEGLRLPIEGN